MLQFDQDVMYKALNLLTYCESFSPSPVQRLSGTSFLWWLLVFQPTLSCMATSHPKAIWLKSSDDGNWCPCDTTLSFSVAVWSKTWLLKSLPRDIGVRKSLCNSLTMFHCPLNSLGQDTPSWATKNADIAIAAFRGSIWCWEFGTKNKEWGEDRQGK